MVDRSSLRRLSAVLCRCTFIGVLLVLAASACGPIPTPPPIPTDTLEPTPRPALATPTATATRTAAPTRTLPPEPPAVTPTSTAEPTNTRAPTRAPTHTPTPTPTASPTATATSTSPPTALPTATAAPGGAPTATLVPTAIPVATATPVAATTAWRGAYYANPDLHGNPALVRDDAAVGFDWGTEAPAPGLPADAFSVRWTGVASFAEGAYLFHATMDDGMRVYVDDELLIDEWRDRPEREVTVRRQMAAGAHPLRVEYYERGHRAVAKLWWEPERSFSGWKGHYWANQDLEGNPLLVRDDPQVSFDWQLGGPGGGIPNDHFSARWTRTLHLQDGTYRFRLVMDDGARLRVDDVLVIDEWRDHAAREVREDYVVAGTGAHEIVVEYYDNTFEARIHLDWERLGDPVYTHWKGEYFANRDLAGAPVLARNDRSLDFNWGLGAPAPSLPADSFSVRWTRDKEFDPGRYRLYFLADDGFRFWVDDKLVLDEWHSALEKTYQVEMDLPWKPRLKVEFYEDGGDAKIKFWWEKI